MPFRFLLTVVGLIFFLAGCSTTLPLVEPGPAEQQLKQKRYQVKILSHDGKKLAATVYQPKLNPGQSAPLIVATHGFGGFRAKRPLSIYGKTMITGQAAIEAWRKGYWVVFYDQRGWGGSQGKVHMTEDEFDVADVSDVITWSLEHLPAIATLDDGEPAIGMIGESQAGAIQMVAAMKDPRIKVITPIATYHDLNSIAPQGLQKSAWGASLLGIGTISSGFDNGFMYKKPFSTAVWTGKANSEMQQWFYEHSPASRCDNHLTPNADALFIQGYRDTIFDMQQAVDNAKCVKEGGNEARILAIQGGHILPWPLQSWTGKPFFNTDKNLFCGDYKTKTTTAIVDYWDEKLKNLDAKVPQYCINLDYTQGLEPDQFPPRHSKAFTIPRSGVIAPASGLFEAFMVPADNVGDLFRGLWRGADLRFTKPNGGIGRPKFIPVYIANQDEALIGTPTVDLRVSGMGKSSAMKLFVGVGVQHAGKRRVKVAGDQLMPLPGKGVYRLDLSDIAVSLKSGDRVGLVVYGFTAQHFWRNSASWFIWRQAFVDGSMTLPLTHYTYKDTNYLRNRN